MNGFKRLFFSLRAHLDGVVNDFENHEALAKMAIKDLERVGVRTQAQRNRLQNRIDKLAEKIAGLKKEAELWSVRAVKMEPVDEGRALECVRRLQQAQRQIERLEDELQKAEGLKERLNEDLDKIADRLEAVKTKKEILCARHNRSEAALGMTSSGGCCDMEELFERWEEKIAGYEFRVQGDDAGIDRLSAEFQKEEETARLKQALRELCEKSGK